MRPSNALVVTVSLVLALAAVEGTLHFLNISYPEFNRLDVKYGWTPRPGVEGWYAFEGRTRFAINRDGFRDIDHEIAKPDGVFRIAVLGDSFTEGREVPLERTFWKVMEARLQDCAVPGAKAVEVLGFGVNGYGAAQELMVLRDKVWKYHPDAVVLAFFTGNDVINNEPALDRHPDRSYYRLENEALVFDDSRQRTADFERRKTWGDIKHGVYNALRSLQVLRQAYLSLKSAYKYRDAPLLEQLNAGLQPELYREPSGPWVHAWAVTEALVRQIALEVEEGGAEFWLATLGNPIQVTADEAVRRKFADSLGVPDLLYPDRRLAKLADSGGLRVVTLVEPLRAAAKSLGLSLHGSARFAGGHWNAHGHRVAGEALAERICDGTR
jgi:lysophospholipase L1-like esterase